MKDYELAQKIAVLYKEVRSPLIDENIIHSTQEIFDVDKIYQKIYNEVKELKKSA